MSTLDALFKPKSIAIVGVSDDPTKLGSVILSNLIEAKYKGRIYPVNPKYDVLFGYKTYKKVSEIKEGVDLVCIAIPSVFVKDTLIDCAKKKVKAAVIITAGFKEIGGEGEMMEKEIIEEARKAGIKILGPNCLGLIVPSEGNNTSFAASFPNDGNIAFLSQSGAFCTAILDMSLEKNVGFSHFISLGNKSDINENEIVENWLEDDNVKVIGAYLEEMSDGKKFVDILRKSKKNKPFVIFKPGKCNESISAISSHTGSLAGSMETFQTAVKQAGVVEVDEFNLMFYLMMSFSWASIPKGNRVAVITNAGGPGIVATDQLVENGLTLAKISDESKKAIAKHLPPTASVNNPIDVIGDALAERYRVPIDILVHDENVDSILVILTPQLVTQIEDTAKLIINSAKLSNKPIFAVFLGGKYIQHGLQRLYDNKVPVFLYLRDAIIAMSEMYKYGQMIEKKNTKRTRTPILADLNIGQHKSEVLKSVNKNGEAISEKLSAKLAEEVGIELPKQSVVHSFDEALKFSQGLYPVVIKATSDVISHKTDDKALYLNISDDDQLKDCYTKLESLLLNKFKVKVPAILIQEQIKAEQEVFIGVNRDGGADVYENDTKGFGHLLAFGQGGIYTEIFRDLGYALVPARRYEIEDSFNETKISRIVKGARGKDPLAYDKILETIEKVQKLVIKYPEIISLDINPLLVTKDRAIVVDMKVFVG